MSKFLIVVFLSLGWLNLCFAGTAQTISESRQWNKLLHKADFLSTSVITNKEFFLSPTGNTDSLAELHATLLAFSQPMLETEIDAHPQCRFPARAIFLHRNDLLSELKIFQCKEFQFWKGEDQDLQISVVYADGYMGNPASFYGHLLLKVDSTKANYTSELLSNSLNFGAKVPDDENPVVYILKGLTGGYSAYFNSNYFYRYNLSYSEIELRDLWQYKLSLDAAQMELMVAHAWELLSAQYTYFFTSRNCAYHIAKMLELVIEEDLVSPSEPFVLPITIFQRLNNATIDERPAIAEITKIQSRQNRFRQKFASLSDAQKETVKQWIAVAESSDGTIKVDLQSYSNAQSIAILDTLIDYFEFRIRSEDLPWLKKAKRQVLLRRLKFTGSAYSVADEDNIALPHTGQKPTMLRLSATHYSNNENALLMQFRPAYYDLLSLDQGHMPNSSLSMADLTLSIEDQDITLEKLDLIKIETMNISPTQLPSDGGLAWKLRVGWDRERLLGQNANLVAFAEGGVGLAAEWTNTTFYAFGEVRWQQPDQVARQVLITPRIGFTHQFDLVKVHCNLSYPIAADHSQESKREKYQCEARLYADTELDIRIGASKYESSEAHLSLSLYF